MYRFPIAPVANPGLSTAQLAARTGLPAGTLRMWERRHGFPAPARLPGRHRRYSDGDVELVLAVTRLRAEGLSLAAAIERARSVAAAPPASLFASLRRLHPDVQPITLAKRPLLSLTRAIEDEYSIRAAGGLLLACFQRERFYRHAERRWLELARSAQLAVAIADFSVLAEPAGAAVEVPVPAGQPLAREWVLVIDAPDARACLAAWEQPAQREPPDAKRRFEVLWSFEPSVVRAAATVAARLVRGLAPGVAARIPAALAEPMPAAVPELRFATSLANRVVGYLAAQ